MSNFNETHMAGMLLSLWDALAPVAAQTLWDWSTTSMVIPDSESSSLGSFSVQRAAPFHRVHDIITSRKLKRAVSQQDPHAWRCEQLWVIWSAQCGKTVSTAYPGFSWVALHFPHQPAAFYWPTIDVKKTQLRDRLEPLWQATPDLAALMPVSGTEDYSRRIGERTWRIKNGLRAGMRVGNIANDLRANPFCNTFFDEFDALKLDVGGQGDPLRLAIDRQRTFTDDKLLVGVTTPSTVEAHGWRKLCDGTHERLMVACSECKGLDWVNPDQVKAMHSEAIPDPTPQQIVRGDLAVWCCRHCGMQHRTDAVRTMVTSALDADRWIDGDWTADDDHPRGFWTPNLTLDGAGHFAGEWPVVDSEIRSIHGNILMTDVWTLGKFLSEELQALAGSEKDRKTHWNTARAEPYFAQSSMSATIEERAGIVNGDRVRGVVPAEAKYLLLMFDQQGNTERTAWFPWVLRAVAEGGESWLVDTGQVPKSGGEVPGGFGGVNELVNRSWPVAGSPTQRKMADLVFMDGANGTMATAVRMWAAQEPNKRVLVWGSPTLRQDEHWRQYIPGKRAKIPWPVAVKGWLINSNFWRDRVDDRRRRVPGAPCWWLCADVPNYYLKSIWDSEVRIVVQRQITGQGVREIVAWQPAATTNGKDITYRRDNHWWDCEVALAAILNIYGVDKTEITAAKKKQPRRYRAGRITTKEE